MNKFIFFLLLFLLGSLHLNAQTSVTHNSTRSNQLGGSMGHGSLSGGVSVGSTAFLPSGVKTTVSEVAYKPGLDLGGFLELKLGSVLGLEIGAAYQTRNWGLLLDSLGNQVKEKKEHAYSYLNFPILLKAKLGPGFQVALGPNIAYMLSATETSYQLEDGQAGTPSEQDLLEFFNRLDLGANLELGYEFNNGLGIHANTNINLLEVVKEAPTIGTSEILNRNMTLKLALSYRFGKKG